MTKRTAIEMDRYGGPEVLRPVMRPMWSPRAGEVVVEMVAAGVNRADAFIRSGEWPVGGGFPYVPGLEVAGVVSAVGPEVTLSVGDGVITMMQKLGGIHGTRAGGYQSHVLVPAATLARLPAGMSPLEAAKLGLPAVTALLALRVLGEVAGKRVLVHAGSSAVGSMAIQLLAGRGAQVIASGTRPEKFPFMRLAGASQVVSTTDPEWSQQAGLLEGVFDLVGRATFAASVHALAPGGRLVFVGGTSGGDLALSGWDLMRPAVLTGYSSETLTRDELQQAMDELAVARVRCLSLAEFPLTQAADAHAAMESGKLQGRILLRPPAS